MAVGKKGIFFTVMALLIVAFLLTSQRIGQTPLTSNTADTAAARSRVSVMNSYSDTFETQAANSLSIAGYFALQNMSASVRRNSTYIKDINNSIDYCIRVQPGGCIPGNYTVSTTLSNVTALAKSNLSIDTAYKIEKAWVTEEQPFEVVLWMNISYNVSDPFANWTVTNKTIRAPVDVTGIEDPAYAYANSTGLMKTRSFKKPYIRRGQFNLTTFIEHYDNKSYIANPGVNPPGKYYFAPSVLQRYTGNLTNGSACCGIESIVYFYDFSPASQAWTPPTATWNGSQVDYHVFSLPQIAAFNCTDTSLSGSAKLNSSITAMPYTRIRLDNYHLSNVYANMSAYTNATCIYP